MLPERIRQLDVEIAGAPAGQLLRHSVYEFRYLDGRADQPAVALLMPPTRPTYQDGDLFAVMDQNLPEGDLYLRLRAMFPKQQLTPMHLLAVVGSNGIGRLGFRLPGAEPLAAPRIIDRKTLLQTRYTPEVFDDLVRAYLSTGAGIAGMQPKIMVPDRVTLPVPTIIVKAAAPSYPGLSANEFMCLTAACHAGIETPTFDLSDDGQLLLVDRFDIAADGSRIGFEDIAALMNLRVRDIQSDRKYHGSYQRIAELMQYLQLPSGNLARFFEQVAFSIMVRNGDGHLKNYGLLYTSTADCRLAPMFDVVTTAIYRYTRYEGGPELEDRTLALKLFAGKGHTRAYPTTEELLLFGSKVCGVAKPALVLERIAEGMRKTLDQARGDQRIPKDLLLKMRDTWTDGMIYARAR
ncbi:type II toxin-antitoxin system HipA family toxin [Variovorax sp. CAN2819]|uniref:type II toxin-antitoxin system HipA family toxin n=1 Tax=Variovorax sp. CAN15 TaxID=3046727 RepID=UPI0026473D9E|nr:type II toxin-antitoxin system HipA family toxin [Variovorax sp. CAN15]MDN6886249.1 type II toxin-antitoxin system HipA family toxin [Variovorax sp. CAN15]